LCEKYFTLSDGIKDVLKKVDSKIVKKAAVASLNRTAKRAYTDADKELRKI